MVAASLGIGAASAGPASARAPKQLSPGVFADPGSPAGKEYAFPLTVARSQADGQSPSADHGSPPLFGVGIRPATGAGQGVNGKRTPRRPGAGSSQRTTSTPAGAGQGGGAPPSAATLARLTTPGSAVPAVALVAGLVLALGLALGAGLGWTRRRT